MVSLFVVCLFSHRSLQDVQFVLQFVKYKLELQFVPVQTEEIFILAKSSYISICTSVRIDFFDEKYKLRAQFVLVPQIVPP